MDLTGNPWSFVPADASTSIAITSIVRNSQGSATVTATAHGHSENDFISIQGASPAGWNGGYRVLAVLSANTFLIEVAGFRTTLSNAGAAGHVLTLAYSQIIEVTQMLWDGPTAADVLSLTDSSGRLVWKPTAVTGGSYTYMKAFPIVGLVINALPSGTLQISV
jgi:hypothetical protein